MKNEDIQNIVLSKCQKSEQPKKNILRFGEIFKLSDGFVTVQHGPQHECGCSLKNKRYFSDHSQQVNDETSHGLVRRVFTRCLTNFFSQNRLVNHDRYLWCLLPVIRDCSNKVFSDNWTFQQESAAPHTHKDTLRWYRTNLPTFIDKDVWPPKSHDLIPMNYCIRSETFLVFPCNKITLKNALVLEWKRAVKMICRNITLESYASWTYRLRAMSKNNRQYLQIEKIEVLCRIKRRIFLKQDKLNRLKHPQRCREISQVAIYSGPPVISMGSLFHWLFHIILSWHRDRSERKSELMIIWIEQRTLCM